MLAAAYNRDMTHTHRFRASGIAGNRDSHDFIYNARLAYRAGRMTLEFGDNPAVFPNGAVPWAIAYRFFRKLGLPIVTQSIPEPIRRTHILDPLSVSDLDQHADAVLNKVWVYKTEAEAARLAHAFISALEHMVECGEGTSESLNWCLYEVMDNVFQHSEASEGVAMMQIHFRSRHCAVAVGDDGIGIHRSFIENGVYSAADAYEAIKLAIQEKVTSKPKNMGNGLFGLMRTIGTGKGELTIHSGRGTLVYRDMKLTGGSSMSIPLLDAETHQGTVVDWQLDVSRPIDLRQVLGMPRIPNLEREKYETSDGVFTVRVLDFEDSLGSRRTAESVRTKLLNILGQGITVLDLDFSGVNVVSSSFADEVLGKLALRMGLIEFFRRFRLVGMNEIVEALVNRAIQQRIAEGDSETPGSRTTAIDRV